MRIRVLFQTHSECFSLPTISNFYIIEHAQPLQRLAADELGPAADFTGNALPARKLLAHALSKENGSLGSC